jgi:hypothetical protein
VLLNCAHVDAQRQKGGRVEQSGPASWCSHLVQQRGDMAAKIPRPAFEFLRAEGGFAVPGSGLQVLQQDTRIAQVSRVCQRPDIGEERPDVMLGRAQVTGPPERGAGDLVSGSLYRVHNSDIRNVRVHNPQPVTQVYAGVPGIGSVPQPLYDLHHFREVPDSPVPIRPVLPQTRVPARRVRSAGWRLWGKVGWQMQVSPGDPEHLVIGEQAGDRQAVDHLHGHLVLS